MKAVRERSSHPLKRPSQPEKASFVSRMFEPVDIASLVFFRIAFGAVLLAEVIMYLAHGWVREEFIEPVFHFSYYGFGWVHPWPGDWMIVHFAVLGVLAVLIMVGLFYRVAMTLFFFGFAYVFLLDASRYINHLYLVLLFAFLMIFVPAHRSFSLDVRRNPEFRSETAPAWALWILRIQMGIVYFFGGVAKINRDWFHGEPLRGWMAARTDFPVIGGLFTQPWVVYAFAYGSLLLDLFAFPLLLMKRTRPFAFAALLLFHLMNSRLFDIGIFPWLAIAATTLFFDPGWPRALLGRRRQQPRVSKRSLKKIRAQEEEAPMALGRAHRVTVALLALYLAVQVLVPLRHFVYAGDVSWTEEGQRFSWQMMLRQKKMLARFFVTDPDTGERIEVDPAKYLTSFQYGPMGIHPYLLLEFAHYLGSEYASQDGRPAEVQAHVVATLNGRRAQLLVDPRVDLARASPSPSTWIVPLGDDLWIPPPGSQAPDVVQYVEEVYGVQGEDRPPIGPVPPA